MTTTNSWFRVDKEGLRKIVERRGMLAVVAELLQNAFDTNATRVAVTLAKTERGLAELAVVDDDPNGFADLSHAYTIFAESEKKVDPTKRGRFNLGEKLVLAICKSASVSSTKGSVTFHEDGTMTHSPYHKTSRGSSFTGVLRMNVQQYTEVMEGLHTLIPPSRCMTTINGERLKTREPIATFEVSLPTVIADEEGVLRPTKRKCTVEVHEPKDGETASIYELGIPVVETGDRYHCNVMQKVPLTMERDNVPPAYLKLLRAEVLNHTATMLTTDEASESWVTNALESPAVESEAVVEAMDKRYGKDRASYDPTDREANMTLQSRGFTVLTGRMLPKDAWEQVRRASAITPAGQLAPTPKPYSLDPDACEVTVIDRADWSKGMCEVEEISRWLATRLGVHDDLLVRFVKPTQRHWVAAWGGHLDWNVSALGNKWFESWPEHVTYLLDILLHEFAHESAGNHLDEKFHEACTRLGGKLAALLVRGERMPHSKRVGKGEASRS